MSYHVDELRQMNLEIQEEEAALKASAEALSDRKKALKGKQKEYMAATLEAFQKGEH